MNNKQSKLLAPGRLCSLQKEEKLQETTHRTELVGMGTFDAAFLFSPKSQSSMSVYSHSKFKLVCSIMHV